MYFLSEIDKDRVPEEPANEEDASVAAVDESPANRKRKLEESEILITKRVSLLFLRLSDFMIL